MLKFLGVLGLAAALILSVIYIRILMEIANYIGGKVRKLITSLIRSYKNN